MNYQRSTIRQQRINERIATKQAHSTGITKLQMFGIAISIVALFFIADATRPNCSDLKGVSVDQSTVELYATCK